ncbi:MAG TPA: DUF2478 domain-containing protein [Noviherbaspirillum sp.]|uniref:DUF2478 domain-containing protein n=1 Tax=Noviherbaspirillum sp. TaxID=1926288 RepID=UPI002D4D13D2|nr:DUF2478 domain-containing protein [Noviherbaspirillum sp.]HYD95023.1 DUF2478 domain-containing protein [Noviherbaspirillum sp.]
MSNPPPSPLGHIAAVVYPSGTDPSPVLADAVRTLQARQVQVAGVIERNVGPCDMVLEILPGGDRIGISQDLGSSATGCRLDTTALADAAAQVGAAIRNAPGLVVFNKFGAREAAGEGLRAEMAEAAVAGTPILTAVKDSLLEEWTAFLGGKSVLLPCSSDAVLEWWQELARG